MSKQITITMPDDVHKGLELASEESLRPLATEAVYRIKLGLGGVSSRGKAGDILNGAFEGQPKYKDSNKLKDFGTEKEERSYSEVLEFLDKVMQEGYQMEADEKSKMNRLVKEAGLVWNGSSKKLWKQDGENWELIKEY